MALKQRIIAITGGVSASIGAAGAAIAEFGLCPCIVAPAMSVAGIASIAGGFLSANRTYFFAGGTGFLLLSMILHTRKKSCMIHTGRRKI